MDICTLYSSFQAEGSANNNGSEVLDQAGVSQLGKLLLNFFKSNFLPLGTPYPELTRISPQSTKTLILSKKSFFLMSHTDVIFFC